MEFPDNCCPIQEAPGTIIDEYRRALVSHTIGPGYKYPDV